MEYLYRNDVITSLILVQNAFRARRCTSRFLDGFKHELLTNELNTLNENEGLYYSCYWSKEEKALNDASSTLGLLALRFPYENNIVNLYNISWDPHFEKGEAYLFWGIERLCNSSNFYINTSFSTTGVNLDLIEIANNGNWIPYYEYMEKYSSDLIDEINGFIIG